jgi:hypothetical protein
MNPAPMTEESNDTPIRPRRSVARRVFAFFSGYQLATVLLVLVGVLTWLATLEQVDSGLYATLNKYFDWRSWYIFPEVSRTTVWIPLPGGYWVCVLLFINLLLGGILRARKGWKHAGILIAHSGILFLLAGGGVAHLFSQRGNLAVMEGKTSNVAEDYYDSVVEVAEVKGGKIESVRVIDGKYLGDGMSFVRLPGLPFDLEFSGFMRNARVVSAESTDPRGGVIVVDGYFPARLADEKQAESNESACYASVVRGDGSKGNLFILSSGAFQPFTVSEGGRVFAISMGKRQWVMPFAVRLEKFTAEFHPGTMKPKAFTSVIHRVEDGREAGVTIRMNEPMRYKGYTFFQSSYGPQGAMPGQPMYSVFEVVRNPADKWPEWSLYVVSFGLLTHFLIKLAGHFRRLKKPQCHD